MLVTSVPVYLLLTLGRFYKGVLEPCQASVIKIFNENS